MQPFLRPLFAASFALALAACTTTNGSDSGEHSARRQEIDAGAVTALSRLQTKVDGAGELVAKAKGVVVIPRVLSAGLIVGGSRGQGELLVGSHPQGYYSATGASIGVVAGAQAKDVFLLFMTDAALEKFRASSGWTVGIDGSVALVKVGASGRIDSESARHDVIGFLLSDGGLMIDFSIEGTKLSRLAL